MVFSFNFTVLTQYPRIQKCTPRHLLEEYALTLSSAQQKNPSNEQKKVHPRLVYCATTCRSQSPTRQNAPLHQGTSQVESICLWIDDSC